MEKIILREDVKRRIERYLHELCTPFKRCRFLSNAWYEVPMEEMFQFPVQTPNANTPLLEKERTADEMRNVVNWELGQVRSGYRVIVLPSEVGEQGVFKIRLVNTYYLGGIDKFEFIHPPLHS